MSDALAAFVAAGLARPVPDAVRAFAATLAGDGVRAILFYGSNLRTGSLDGVLDFYVLTAGPRERGMWPRVGYREEGEMRAKIATMGLATFAAAARDATLDTTVWARFVQPSALVWAASEADAAAVRDAVAAAAVTAARYAAALGPAEGAPSDYWAALFRATYRAELRMEKPGREGSILATAPGHFDALLPLAWDLGGIEYARRRPGLDPGSRSPAVGDQREPGSRAGVTGSWGDTILMPSLPDRAAILARWRRRRRAGKPLNVARLVRAAFTFDGAARYAAWKIERHTGVAVAITPFRERHPVLAAPGVLWRVWRARG